MAGPKRPEGRIALTDIKSGFETALTAEYKKPGEIGKRVPVEGKPFDLGHGDVVIAAITSCTNTSNPSVLIAAGLLARNAVESRPDAEALGQDLAGAGIAGRCRLSDEVGLTDLPRPARIQSGRLRLHDLHRELGSARIRRFRKRSTTTASLRRPCFRAIAISRAASAPTCRRTIWRRRRSSSPTRWRAPCRRI